MRRAMLGMPTLLELPDLETSAVLAAELGLSFVEMNMNLPLYQPGRLEETHIDRVRDQYGIGYTLHLDENLSPCDFNPYVAKAYRRTATEAIALAARHGMRTVTMHMNPGVYFTLPDEKRYLYDCYRKEYMEALRMLRDLCEEAVGGSGVKICIENTDGFVPFVREGVEMLLQSQAFNLTLDIGHSHCAQNADIPFYTQHADRIAHMHIHDADASGCHLPIGAGVLDIRGALRRAAETGCAAVIEVKTVAGLRQSVDAIRHMPL